MIRDRINDDAATLDRIAALLAPILAEIDRTQPAVADTEDVLNEAHDALAGVAGGLRAAAIKLRDGAAEAARASLADQRQRETI